MQVTPTFAAKVMTSYNLFFKGKKTIFSQVKTVKTRLFLFPAGCV